MPETRLQKARAVHVGYIYQPSVRPALVVEGDHWLSHSQMTALGSASVNDRTVVIGPDWAEQDQSWGV